MMWFEIQSVRISPTLLAGIVVGGGVFLVILILLCICLCCGRKDGKSKTRVQNVSVESPPDTKGDHHDMSAQQWQQQNHLPRKAKFFVVPDHNPSTAPAVASQLQRPPSRSPSDLPRQAYMSTTSGSSLAPHSSRRSPTPQVPPPYMSSSGGSGRSNLSRHESSIPSPSSVPSFGSSQIIFTYEELAMATNGFSEANILGQGGFGFVHKGVLPNGKEVAVKSLKANSGQGEREFLAEIETISRVHHRHLVALVGYCITGSQRLLVYEFAPNMTLEFHLHGKGRPTMDWATRLKVAVGAAKGLAYLHEDCQPRIIHRDIKAANILLDNDFQAKVADFGLAKFASEADTHVSTRVMGTLGYLSPEYAATGKLTEKSDIYSFGVLLLELITGRIPIDRTQEEYNLVDWAKPLLTTAIEDENFKYLVDSRLQDCYKHDEMARMVSCAATCVRKSAKRRPLMSQVIRALEGNISLSDIDKGITPGRSLVNRYGSDLGYSGSQYRATSKGFQSSSEYSSNQYNGNSRGFSSTGLTDSTSEHDGTTSEYGLCTSSSSSDCLTTPELGTKVVKRENRHFQ